MDEAAVHAVDGLAAFGPEWLFAIGALAIMALLAVRALPLWKELREKSLDIERRREERKAEEARMRDERDRENSAIASRQVDAQERSTAAMTAMTAQMAAMEQALKVSRHGSQKMRDQMGDMAHKVDEIHMTVVRR